MCDEKDMIEINLNEPQQKDQHHHHHQAHQHTHHQRAKAVNYLANIRFVRNSTAAAAAAASSGNNSNKHNMKRFAYDQQRNDDDEDEKSGNHQQPKSATSAPRLADDVTLRQLYCPDCQQRLDAKNVVHYDKLFTCCLLPFMPLQRLLQRGVLKRQGVPRVPRKLYCGKCGCSLGYWEKCT